MTNKIKLPVVVFEPSSSNVGSVKLPVIKDMFLDVANISSMGIRKWDSKRSEKTENWTVLFDKLKDGESIVLAIDIDTAILHFEKLGVIKIMG